MPRAKRPKPEPERGWVVKAETVSAKMPSTMSRITPDEEDAFLADLSGADVVPFPLPRGFKDPEWFIKVWRSSAALQPAIRAYATDIDGMGHTFKPAFDPNKETALEELRESHELLRTWEQMYSGKQESDVHKVPDDQELQYELEGLKRESRKQRLIAEYFFKSAVREKSFKRMRRNTRTDSGIGGNWYWEVVRRNGKPMRLKHPPFHTMRACREDKEPTVVKSELWLSPVHSVEFEEERRFRKYIQKTKNTGKKTFFKQWGDPRPMCACCGKRYPKADDDDQASKIAQRQHHDTFRPATEIIHDGDVYVPGSPYFYPLWLGALHYAVGGEAAAEANLAFFNNPMPAGMILCAGGKFADGLKEQLQEFMAQMVLNGPAAGHHKILTVSAVASSPDLLKDGSAKVDLKWIPLEKERPKDALFLKWIELCEEKVGRQFRLHTLLYGGGGKINRAVAWAILKFTEERVYQPIRGDFDDLMNMTLMPAIGVTLWRFETLSPETRDPTTLSKIYDLIQKGPALTIDELRELVSEITNREYEPYNKDWSKFPHKMLQYAHDENASLDGDEGANSEPEQDDGSTEPEEDTGPPGDTGETETE